jgi:hypothetical protein
LLALDRAVQRRDHGGVGGGQQLVVQAVALDRLRRQLHQAGAGIDALDASAQLLLHQISFQILAFCLTVLPYWLLLLLTVLIIEFATVGRLRKPKEPS